MRDGLLSGGDYFVVQTRIPAGRYSVGVDPKLFWGNYACARGPARSGARRR